MIRYCEHHNTIRNDTLFNQFETENDCRFQLESFFFNQDPVKLFTWKLSDVLSNILYIYAHSKHITGMFLSVVTYHLLYIV